MPDEVPFKVGDTVILKTIENTIESHGVSRKMERAYASGKEEYTVRRVKEFGICLEEVSGIWHPKDFEKAESALSGHLEIKPIC